MAVCESCHLTVSKLKNNISRLEAELKLKNKRVLEFSAVATAQAKHLILGSSGCDVWDRSSTRSHDC